MFGAKYQWILAGKYGDDNWWRDGDQEAAVTLTWTTAAEAEERERNKSGDDDDDDDERCSDETLRLALNGYICADILILSLLHRPTVADLVSRTVLTR